MQPGSVDLSLGNHSTQQQDGGILDTATLEKCKPKKELLSLRRIPRHSPHRNGTFGALCLVWYCGAAAFVVSYENDQKKCQSSLWAHDKRQYRIEKKSIAVFKSDSFGLVLSHVTCCLAVLLLPCGLEPSYATHNAFFLGAWRRGASFRLPVSALSF